MTRNKISARLLFAALVLTPALGRAEITVLGPTPYRSATDSPFARYLGGPDFYLEDFEDGELDTPGIFQAFSPITHGRIAPVGLPSGDDANALQSQAFIVRPAFPPISTSFLNFGFDNVNLGRLPNTFGFVLTLSPPDAAINLSAFDSSGLLIGTTSFDLSSQRLDATDLFVGATYSSGVANVEILVTYPGNPISFSIDHVQYGNSIPEPMCISSVCTIGAAATSRRRRYRRVTPQPQGRCT